MATKPPFSGLFTPLLPPPTCRIKHGSLTNDQGLNLKQFLNVIDRDEAERRFRSALKLAPLGAELVSLSDALGRVLACDVEAMVDVPSFDRSNYDGYAVQAADTFGATEEEPRCLRLLPEVIPAGVNPVNEAAPGSAIAIATGGVIPRMANAVVMVEHAEVVGDVLQVRRAVAAGFGVAFAGSDIGAGETILRSGDLLTSRETGVLAAIGASEVSVWRKPIVGVISTGDELLSPAESMAPGRVFDSNNRILADAVREAGGEPKEFGIVADDLAALRSIVTEAIAECDIVLLSGGTSKGEGDLCYHAVRELTEPGILAHGVALKPGKPVCLAAHGDKPVVILPGFPTSAIFTFHEFVAPLIRIYAGTEEASRNSVSAEMAVPFNSEIGRTEYLLVGLVRRPTSRENAGPQFAAYPMGKGSGSVTTFSSADGFVVIDRHHEIIPAGDLVDVRLLGADLQLADLVVIGSHCIGLDYLLGELHRKGVKSKFLAVGSTAGIEAARRGECDIAGIHLLDPATGKYNTPFLTPDLACVAGYGRQQGFLFRADDSRFANMNGADAVLAAADDASCVMVNRNRGSGTRILIDRLLAGRRPVGYPTGARSHNAVAAAIAQGRADWGIAIEGVAKRKGLGFLPIEAEQFDFVIPASRRHLPAVAEFVALLSRPDVAKRLAELGFQPTVAEK